MIIYNYGMEVCRPNSVHRVSSTVDLINIPKGPFGNVILITLFKCCENMCG